MKRRSIWWGLLSLTVALGVISSMMLLDDEEEDDEDPGEPGTFRRSLPQELAVVHADVRPVVDQVEARIARLSQSARRRLRRHRALFLLTAGLTTAIPVIAAAGGAPWVMALFGALASFVQITSQLTEDYRIGVQQHLLAVQMSRVLRRFRRQLENTRNRAGRQSAVTALLAELDELDQDASTRISGVLLGGPASITPAHR